MFSVAHNSVNTLNLGISVIYQGFLAKMKNRFKAGRLLDVNACIVFVDVVCLSRIAWHQRNAQARKLNCGHNLDLSKAIDLNEISFLSLLYPEL